MARYLGMEPGDFRRRHVRLIGQRRSLVERPGGDCVFLGEDRRCLVHPVKPRQCITFPFWPRHVASRRAWTELARKCPGMDRGRLFAPAEVERLTDPGTPLPELRALLGPREEHSNA